MCSMRSERTRKKTYPRVWEVRFGQSGVVCAREEREKARRRTNKGRGKRAIMPPRSPIKNI